MKDRIRIANPRELIASAIVDNRVERNTTPLGTFYLGQVRNVTDNKNANRIQVRIPLLDDSLYYNKNAQLDEKQGDDKLPWCIPALGRFIETPEVNSVVLVALLDSSTPFGGRIWFTPIKQIYKKNIFSELKPEEEGEKAWKLIEENFEIIREHYPNRKGNKIVNKKSTINFLVGVKGKSNNKLLFEEKSTILIQDEGKLDEAKLILSKLIELKGKNIDILSSNSTKEHRPVFADPLFDHLTQIQNLLSQIATILSLPGKIVLPIPGYDIAPNPSVVALTAAVAQTAISLTKLKIPGSGKSMYIKIN